jgi:PAS domain S-box-containing protein
VGHDTDVLYVRRPEAESAPTFGNGRTAVHEVASLDAVFTTLDDVSVDCIVCESRLDAIDGLDVLAAVRERSRTVPFLLVTDEADGREAAEATRLDATEYVPRDVLTDESLADRVTAALETGSADPTLDSLHAVADSISNAVVAINEDSEVVFANEAVSDLTGYDHEELVGESLTAIIPERLREPHREGVAQYLATGKQNVDWNYVELPMERADGSERTVAVSFGEFTRDGERYFTGSLRDITERKEREEMLSSLLETSSALVDADSQASIADLVTTTTADAFGFEINAVFFHDEETDRLVPAAVTDETREALDEVGTYATSDSRLGEAFTAGESLIVNDLDHDSLGSLLVLPLESHGVLAIGTQTPGAFDDSDRQLAELLTTTATSALNRTERVDSIEQLHHQTRAMLRADGKEAVCRVALDAARDILGHRITGVHLYDSERESLVPTVWADELETLIGTPPAIGRGEGLVWEAYQSDEPAVYDDVTKHEAYNAESPFASELHLPLGDHGVLIVGEPDAGAFDDTDLQLARLLASNAAVALDRVVREAELQRFEAVFENVQDMLFVVDGNGKLTHVTSPLAERVGIDRDELVGMRIPEILEGDTFERGRKLTRSLLSDDERTSATYETTLRTTDSDVFPVEVELSLLPSTRFTGTVGTVRDLSDLERARTELRAERNRFEYLFDNIPDAVVEVQFADGEPVVQSVNSAFEDVFGYDPAAVLGESLNEYILLPEQRDSAETLDRRSTDEIVQAEVRRLTADGPRQFLFRGLSYTDENGDEYGFGIYTDITEQQMRHRQLEVLNRVLRHNLRNDLNVIVGYADQIAADASSEATVEYAESLAATAGDLVDLSNKAREAEQLLDRGNESSWVDACGMVESVVAAARDGNGDATIEFDAPAEAYVAGDERLRVAVENVLQNAIEHNDGERPRVRVTVDGSVDGERVAVRVADDGPGIPEHEQAVVTGEAEITPLQHASGLGLWLVAWIVDAYGGTVTFGDSDLGGAEVSLLLPRLQRNTADETGQ